MLSDQGRVRNRRLDIQAPATSGAPRDGWRNQMGPEERDRVARVGKACLDAGVAERQVKLAEQYGSALANLLRSVFNDRELAMTDSQRERLPDVLRRYLGALEVDRALTA
jgi:hypothetical protein